ncbi:MAG TPA: ABC transporter substrate-binding protein [Gaiellaceae bacterium]|nr:ABC transporter substrate-binding protein [Gaiellaceae bacterium]
MRKRMRAWHLGAAAVVVALAVPAAGVSKTSAVPTSIGPGEGRLTLVAWEGYTQPQWVKPFEQKTGCKVSAKYAGSSNDMFNLMTSGGGGQYDMVSASGDASLRLIYAGAVAETNMSLIPSYKDFYSAFKSPPNNTVGGKHYGVSIQFGPNVLMYNTKAFPKKPTSWAAIYDPKNKGKITIPDNPIQIADAALYLSKTRPSLGIRDPYELTKTQFDAVVNLLKQQRPLVKKYWALASDQIDLFKNGGSTIGASWPYQVNTLEAAKVPVASVIPKEGVTGWLDTWMLSSKAKHPNCAYRWMQWITTPKVQAQQAIYFGETPVNRKACAWMDRLSKGSCAQYSANAPESFYRSIKFWKTPVADCGNGKKDCMDLRAWTNAWTQVKG